MTTVYFVRHAEPNLMNHDDLTRELSAKGGKRPPARHKILAGQENSVFVFQSISTCDRHNLRLCRRESTGNYTDQCIQRASGWDGLDCGF